MTTELRALVLFLKSRSSHWTLTMLLLTALIGFIVGKATLRILNGSGQGVPWAVLLPCAFAVIISVGQHTELAGVEQLAGRRIGAHNAAHVSALTILSLIACYGIARDIVGPIGAPAAMRNLVALLGCALITGAIIGPQLSWIAPLTWTFLAMSFGSGPNADPRWWALPLMPDASRTALTIALAFFAAGIISTGLHLNARAQR